MGSDATCGARIITFNKGTTGKQTGFTTTISNVAYSPVTEDVLEVSFDIKVYDNSTFVETDYSASV